MKVVKHGIYYQDTVKINCCDCDCQFLIDENDLIKYEKPRKVTKTAWCETWVEKMTHYVRCPECNFENPVEKKNILILMTKVKK